MGKSRPLSRPAAARRRAVRAMVGSAAAWAVLCAGAAAGDVIGHPSSEKTESAFLRAAQTAGQQGDLNSAIAFYRRAAQIAPKDPIPMAELGALLEHSEALPGAVEAYRDAAARAPENVLYQMQLGRLALRMDAPAEAQVRFDQAVRLHPEPAAWNGLGVSLDLQGAHARAQSAYAEGLKLAPGDPTLRNNLGLSQALAGDYPAAISTLSALAASPDSTARYRLNLALVYGLAGDDDKAAAAARQDLGEREIASNRAYYAMLRGMGDKSRTEAILGLAGPPAATGAPPPAHR